MWNPLNSERFSLPERNARLPSSLALETRLQQAPDIRSPRSVSKAESDRSEQLPRITLRHAGPYACPVCGAAVRVLSGLPMLGAGASSTPPSSGSRRMPVAPATGGIFASLSCSAAADRAYARPRQKSTKTRKVGMANRKGLPGGIVVHWRCSAESPHGKNGNNPCPHRTPPQG